jgi:hypothetical protein
MSERIAAQIEIGGKVLRSVAQELCEAISTQHVSLEWGGEQFQPNSVDDLLAARDDLQLLRLYDHEASWGELDDLETFLRERKVPFVRYTEGKYEYDPQAVAYHPECGRVEWLTDHSDNAVVQADAVKPIAAALEKIVAEIEAGKLDPATVRPKLQRLCGKLRKALPPEVPALETFEVIG